MPKIHSSSGALSLWAQTSANTQPTKFTTAGCLTSGVGLEWSKRESQMEHPGAAGGGIPSKDRTPPQRLDYTAGVDVSLLARPNIIPLLLMAAGFGVPVSTAGAVTGTCQHVQTLAVNTAMPFIGCIHDLGTGADKFSRRVLDARATSLSLDVGKKDSKFSLKLQSANEGDVTGTPVFSSEVDAKLVPELGALTVAINSPVGTAVALINNADKAPKTLKWEIGQSFEGEDDRIYVATPYIAERTDITSKLTLGGVVGSAAFWKSIDRGNSTATSPQRTVARGSLSFSLASLEKIGATTAPYSYTVAFSDVWFESAGPMQANGDEFVMADMVAYTVINATASITCTTINAVQDYVAA